ncbi:peptidoglycan-binding protein [Myxococcus sp. K15C18031901]|uniref:peptidoglycan-binding protein n=1 Tax=Myxococcus dinghuensis TaxID=2906761 RepID=UPI0020A725D9|nr:peptidoglycan-binding protein [Myxococcus dinghuensis]MCP3104051.1 peptidoglycan-binding protein [Myxococcus dinghuensis]
MSGVSATGSRRVATTATSSTPPTVREGAKGATVTDLQKRLAAAGFNPGPVDGLFGPKTEKAVKAFQKAKGLAQDGIVGPKTWGALKAGGVKPPTGKPPQGKGSVETFVQKALAQAGDKYIFGAETRLDDPNPKAFDCSELVEWAAAQAGVHMPDGTMNQVPYCKQKGTTLSVAEALKTRGALLFKPGHVAISLGDGRTIEAKGSAYGVGIFSAKGRGWTSGALVPGLKY